MKICIPVTESKGLQSPFSAHYGSAPFFVIADTETKEHSVIAKSSEEGQCGSFPFITQNNVSAIVCSGMGRRALENLNRSNVKAFIPNTICATAEDAITAFNSKQCREMTAESSCTHGHDHGGHGHGKDCNH